MIPPHVLDSVAEALDAPGDQLRVGPGASGGCINNGTRLEAPSGSFFLKWRLEAEPGLFRLEASGLAALRSGPIRVPGVVAHGPDWLLLQWVEEGVPKEKDWAALGVGLAQLHRGTGHTRWGWGEDNYIGSLEQPNGWFESWHRFWSDRRIRPLTDRALAEGLLDGAEARLLTEATAAAADLIEEASDRDGPSLVHGDLWSGNVLFDGSGGPVLIDPAVYVGHREMDLAMTELFGGFHGRFYEAYRKAWPFEPGYEARRSAYQLYPLLVHLKLFGRGYAGGLMRAAAAVVGSR